MLSTQLLAISLGTGGAGPCSGRSPNPPEPQAHQQHQPSHAALRAILRSVTLASHDILSHRQPHSSSVSSCEGAWDPATGGGHFKGRPAHSCSLSLQQPAPGNLLGPVVLDLFSRHL
ncbi:unnamed protein product [Pleuronectes platessa]|uniref:Secreted protein n=1 Tax=Pleuronectes platessa TaxID=8262 RepID=A0A9N7UMH4_PLEPL|nr:unnamed protein product [Pleuronectes platessa]